MRRLPLASQLIFCWLVAAAGCHVLPRRPAQLLMPHRVERGPLVIRSDFSLETKHRLLTELEQLGDRVTGELALPRSDEHIHVYLFGEAADYYDFVHQRFPALPHRRAFFIESDTRLTVYAHWGDHVAVDLRHEVAHGYLHAVVPRLPLWLDEGLAEFFEVPPQQDGRHDAHLKLLTEEQEQGGWQPDLARLEAIRTAADMSQRDYAEAWAWVHYLLRANGGQRDLLKEHLFGLRSTEPPRPLSAALAAFDEDYRQRLVEHVAQLAPPGNL